ncbi:putative indole-3-pyruvate monooxygenase [Rosa chinensis]|uniref:indole-3-pyruvate monooxygenase n=1 Tax=Rosa chinensis TaxID=74649 RepID=A0A2P6REW6_ROSCH|nr:probable indole-3-pyruvate monooxygenase YUCCA10 [Rosa chinensis]PRQ44962.1 putative indole-3-pyruvate monooxygenase [Rosa chinensis]
MEEVEVVIVGAGPAGLATSACLNRLNISNAILEREDCYASLWKSRTYDRLKLHLAKQFCELPYMPFPKNAPTYIPRREFVQYLDTYVSTFNINPMYHRSVETAFYNENVEKWYVVVNNTRLGVKETYYGKFLVVASGENGEGYVPETKGLDTFNGEYIHSSKYENGMKYRGKDVLVVGSGNSGMEIAYDLSNYGANTFIVVRSPVHVLTKEIVFFGMVLSKYLPVKVIDGIVLILGKLKFGNLSKYGIHKPTIGPFYLKEHEGQAPIIDVGTIEKIKSDEIKVLPSITSIEGNEIRFENGYLKSYDAIIFATGYKSTVLKWLKDDNHLFNDNGMPNKSFPNHWKSENGLYCAGFSRRGLFGISHDALKITNDINFSLGRNKKGI